MDAVYLATTQSNNGALNVSSIISRCMCDLPVRNTVGSAGAANTCVASYLSNICTQVLHLAIRQTKAKIMQNSTHIISLDVATSCTKIQQVTKGLAILCVQTNKGFKDQ